jgi:hypothetical protein
MSGVTERYRRRNGDAEGDVALSSTPQRSISGLVAITSGDFVRSNMQTVVSESRRNSWRPSPE